MAYIDAVILDFTERCCRRFQRLTGRTNVWLALQLTNLSIIVYFAGAAVYVWSGDAVVRLAVTAFCGVLLYALARTVLKEPIEGYEIDAFRRVARGIRNPRRIRDAVLRISFLTLSIVLGYPTVFVYVQLRLRIVLLTYSLITLTTIVLYLLACDPLPPCAGTISEWLRRWTPSRLATPTPVPAPAPNRPVQRTLPFLRQ